MVRVRATPVRKRPSAVKQAGEGVLGSDPNPEPDRDPGRGRDPPRLRSLALATLGVSGRDLDAARSVAGDITLGRRAPPAGANLGRPRAAVPYCRAVRPKRPNPVPRVKPVRLAGLSLWLAALAFAAPAARGGEPARVAALLSEDISAYHQALDGFKRAYHGPVIDFDMSAGDERLGDLRASHPDLVLAVGVRAAKAAAGGISDLPIVYCMVLDPDVNGISGPNVTGVTLAIPVQRQLEAMRRVVPGLSRLGVVFTPAKSGVLIQDARSAAAAMGLTLFEESVQRSEQVPDALSRLSGKVDGLWLPPDATVVTKETFQLALELSLTRKIPLMVFNSQFVKAGALLALSPDYQASGADAARVVRQILAGKKPGDIPVSPTRGTLVVNVATAKSLGLDIPASVLQGAKQVQ